MYNLTFSQTDTIGELLKLTLYNFQDNTAKKNPGVTDSILALYMKLRG